MESVIGRYKPKLFKHHKGSTYCVLNDNVIDATNRYANALEDDRRMVLYTDGDLLFIRAHKEFFGKDADTGVARFSPVIDVIEDPDMDPGLIRMVNSHGQVVEAKCSL